MPQSIALKESHKNTFSHEKESTTLVSQRKLHYTEYRHTQILPLAIGRLLTSMNLNKNTLEGMRKKAERFFNIDA